MKKKHIIKSLYFLFAFFVYASSFAGKKAAYDSSYIQQRNFSSSSIKTFQNNKEFQYDKMQEPPKSLWDRLWDWVWQKWDEIMSTQAGQNTMNILLIVFGVVMISFFVWKLNSMNKMSLFAKSGSPLNYNIGEENIHEIDFDEAIRSAVLNTNYRLAVRLLYLQTLKQLTDKNFINWQQNKTNFEYVKEMQQQPLQPAFAALTNIFEFAWYGNNFVTQQRFTEIENKFQQFKHQL